MSRSQLRGDVAPCPWCTRTSCSLTLRPPCRPWRPRRPGHGRACRRRSRPPAPRDADRAPTQLVGREVADRAAGRKHQVGDAALAGHDLLDLLVHGAGAHEPVADHRVGLADTPGPVAGLVLDRRVPPAVVQHDVVGGGEVEARSAGLDRQHQGSRPRPLLELVHQPVAGAPGQPTVVAGHRDAGPLGQVLGQALAPPGEVGEHQHAFPGGEHVVNQLVEPGELPRPALEWSLVVVEIRGRVVADLLEGGDGGEHVALAGAAVLGRRG